MSDSKAKRQGQGTFAQLYDVQEELSQRHSKPLGRPPKKIQRKPTTIHLTQVEIRSLSQLHLLVNDHFSINRSELVGVAIDVLSHIMEHKGDKALAGAHIRDLDSFREFLTSFMDL
ncbi:MAG: hypothetical protein OES12_13175 [Anaerolineae bacterium]|jgi:hypothetical protein|nr:hypothetical protein [Anaerolineae bacterium]